MYVGRAEFIRVDFQIYWPSKFDLRDRLSCTSKPRISPVSQHSWTVSGADCYLCCESLMTAPFAHRPSIQLDTFCASPAFFMSQQLLSHPNRVISSCKNACSISCIGCPGHLGRDGLRCANWPDDFRFATTDSLSSLAHGPGRTNRRPAKRA